MHKITNSERNRVVSILDDSIERIMLLSYVPERAHEAVLAELEPGPYDVFSRHWELEAKGEAAALQESAREVCRCLRDSPRTFAVLQRYGAHDRSESKAFVDALLDLKEVVGRRLGETVQHQRRQEEDLSRARMKSQQAAETKAAVEAEQSRARGPRHLLREPPHLCSTSATPLPHLCLTSAAPCCIRCVGFP